MCSPPAVELRKTNNTEQAEIAVLSNAEHAALLELGDGGTGGESIAGTGASLCLYDLVAVQAERNPQAIAVIETGRKVTYRHLIQHANGLGRQLRRLGVGPEIKVAILADRSAESLIGVLGILAAGGAYVPLDSSFPEERIAFVLDDTEAPVLLAPAALLDRANSAMRRAAKAGTIVVIAAAPASDSLPDSMVTPANAAYVIYTSGSTGTPKGVVVEHRSVVNLIQGFIARHDFAGHRLLMIPPLVFDASVGDVFPVLAAGATLVLHPAPAELGWLELECFCREFKVTAIDAPAALWRRWVEGFTAYADHDALLPDLTLMMIGGESVPLEQVRRFAQLTGNRVVVANHYGPTEASVCATMLTTRDGSELSGADLPIGRPLPGVRVYVLDEDLQLMPRGVVGELCIGGIGVAREYLKRPELSTEAFVRDPFSPAAAARMYRTGDSARWNADGTLQFIGRRDHQVKIRGLRVELREIEMRLAEHPSVREAVVLAREDHPGEKRLVAYVTLEVANSAGAEEIDIEALRSHLNSALPGHMVPAAYVVLPTLPLTPNGKLDRKALPMPDADAYLTREYEAPVGEVETTVARIWKELLQLERIGRNDNFFEMGGHSLSAMTLIERMRQAGLPVEARALFASPTLKSLVEAIGGESHLIVVPPNLIPGDCTEITPTMLPLVSLNQSHIETIVAGVPGGVANVQDIYPLAPLQEGILFHHLLKKEGDVYLAPTLFSIDTRENVNRYIEALQAVIARHDVLRTAVVWEGLPEPVQVVWRHALLTVEEVTLDPAAGDIAEQLHARFDPRHYRIDVRRPPLWRLFIAEDVHNHRWVMLELMHHLAGDHVTLQIMQQEIQTIVQGQAELLPKPLPFRNFVAQARLGVSRKEHEAFFTRMLGDVEEPTAPFGLTDAQGDGSQIVEASRVVDLELCRRLRTQARQTGVTTASLCHLAWAMVLARSSGREDVVFGTVIFGRMQGSEGADRAMGIFINTLPVRIQVGNEGVRESVRRTHGMLMQLLSHEHASLALAQACSQVRPPVPLFTSLLNYRYVGDGKAVLVRDAVSLQETDSATENPASMKLLGGVERSNYPFDISINDLDERLSLDVQVDVSIDPHRVCELMCTALESMVTALEDDPATPVCRLSVLSAAERHQLLVEWNTTQVEYEKDRCVHKLFEAQAAQIPKAVAVVYEKQTLTYSELNQQANQLAHYLKRMGVNTDDRIALCVERSLEMIVGILGILKAGGAYVPLDPAYPTERLEYMLKDAAPKVLLTQSRLRDHLHRYECQTIDLDGDWAMISEESGSSCAANVHAQNLAYVIYTSGSTGKPKGVAVEHRQLCNQLFWTGAALNLGPADRVLQKTSFSVDASIVEILVPLMRGAQIIITRPGREQDVDYLAQLVSENEITYVDVVPALLELLLEHSKRSQWASLRVMCCGGDVLKPELVRAFYQRLPGVLWNAYGPTEATVQSAFTVSTANGQNVPIGKPIANTQIYLLDSSLEPVPVGVAGEMYIGGDGVARGYLNQPALTAEKFIPDRFSTAAGMRLYRTGDLAKWKVDGNIEYLGRVDFQVKIRGFRVELGEIEARLAEHPSVSEAVVVAREDQAGDKRLVAYITPARRTTENDSTTEIDVEALRGYLSSLLPDYMVPAAYVRLESFPLTTNGKLDRKALPAPDTDAYVTHGYEAPVGEVESTIARVWSEVLKLERVGRNDNFFELGGHSLLVMTAISRLQQALEIEIGITDLFTRPQLAALAEWIVDAQLATFSSADLANVLKQMEDADRDTTIFPEL